MDNFLKSILKVGNSWLVPAVLGLALVLVISIKYKFSFTDYLVNKTIQKLNEEYQPYGPNVVAAPQPTVASTTTSQDSPWK